MASLLDGKEHELKTLMRMKPTLKDTSIFFNCSEDTVERFIRDKFDQTFAEFRDQNMVHTRNSIIQKAISKAQAGDNTMLIFCLKNLCGWVDRHESVVEQTVTNKTIATAEEVKEAIKKDKFLKVINGEPR